MAANENFGCIFVEVVDTSQRNKIVGAIYRPPDSNLALFMSGFKTVLRTLSTKKSERLYAVNYNINLIRQDMHDGTGNFVNSLYENSLVTLITRLTRFGKTSSTLIDNIFTNKFNYNAVSGLLITDISDHLPRNKGIDAISSEIVKPVASCIAMPTTSIFNKTLELGKFSEKLKIAKIFTIYKSDDKLQINNYRPISILPIFSKINRPLEILNKNKKAQHSSWHTTKCNML